MKGPLLLNAKRAARYIGVSYDTLKSWRKDDKLPAVPKPVETRGGVYFVVAELDAFIQELVLMRGQPAK